MTAPLAICLIATLIGLVFIAIATIRKTEGWIIVAIIYNISVGIIFWGFMGTGWIVYSESTIIDDLFITKGKNQVLVEGDDYVNTFDSHEMYNSLDSNSVIRYTIYYNMYGDRAKSIKEVLLNYKDPELKSQENLENE